jgi:hypothetical protein
LRLRARLCCTVARGLSRVNRLRMPIGNVERSVLPDVPWLQCDVDNVEARILRNLNGIKLGRVKSLRDSLQRTSQSSISCLFPRGPDASSRAGALHPHEVPACLTDHGIEYRRRDRFYQRPVVGYGLLEGIEAIREDAPLAEKNGMELHARALFDAAGAALPAEPVKGSVDARGLPGNECSPWKSSSKFDGFGFTLFGLATEEPAAAGWFTGGYRCISAR